LATHVLKLQDRNGHSTIEFDTENRKQVEEVRSKFDALITENYLAYTREAGSREAEQVHTFDPQAEETVMTLPIAGG